MATVINFDQRRPDTARDRLNRQTGLNYRDWPESLLDGREDEVERVQPEQPGPQAQTRSPRH